MRILIFNRAWILDATLVRSMLVDQHNQSWYAIIVTSRYASSTKYPGTKADPAHSMISSERRRRKKMKRPRDSFKKLRSPALIPNVRSQSPRNLVVTIWLVSLLSVPFMASGWLLRGRCGYEFCYMCGANYEDIHAMGNEAHKGTCKYHTKNLNRDELQLHHALSLTAAPTRRPGRSTWGK